MIEQALADSPRLSRQRLCAALSLSRATHYRQRGRTAQVEPASTPLAPEPAAATASPTAVAPAPQQAAHPRRLAAAERQQVLETLNSPRYQDLAVPQVYAQLLDEGVYLCSPRTMYRLLAADGQVQERRAQRVHPPRAVPRLRADAPNQVWSWDITKIRCQGMAHLCLYVVIDIFSRFIVAWTLQRKECGQIARQLIDKACQLQQIEPGQLIVHSDRGAPMISQTLGELFTALGVQPSLSRPRVSNDNPYSESQFKTLKYRPEFPPVFASEAQAHETIGALIEWYQTEHRHSGIGYLTPQEVHAGQAEALTQQRRAVLHQACQAHPERFVRGLPEPPRLPAEVFINRPAPAPAPGGNLDQEGITMVA